MVTRRSVLLGLGGVTAIAIGGGAAFAFTRTPTRALTPWQEPGTAADPRVRALEWAVLAPNPHNRQPWLVELVGEDQALVYCDLDRRLPMTDPFDRQITIGLGAFVELYSLGAQHDGFAVELLPFPEGAPASDARLDARPVAQLTLAERPMGFDPLFAEVLKRRTTKEPFTDRPVREPTIAGLGRATHHTTFAGTLEPAHVDRLKDLAWQGWLVEARTPRTWQESVDLIRIGRVEIEANPDGVDLGGPMFEALALAGLLTRETISEPGTMAYTTGLESYRDMMSSSRGFVWLTTPENSRAEQLAAGRDWLRVNLAATAVGLAVHPLSQALQEYEEMATLREAVHDALGATAPRTVQMLARVGYGPQVPPSPRWPARSRLIG